MKSDAEEIQRGKILEKNKSVVLETDWEILNVYD